MTTIDSLDIGGDHQSTGPLDAPTLDQRASQLIHGLQHIQAIIPAMIREVETVRGHLRRAV